MKIYSKILAVLIAVAMILPGVAQAVLVETTTNGIDVHRLAGIDRVGTAVEASKEAYPIGANTVVLVGYNGEVDALTGTLLAGDKNAPLLITLKGSLSPATKAEIARLNANTVYILGESSVVSNAVETELQGLVTTVVRVGGSNRDETAANIAGEVKGGGTDHVFLALGRPTTPGDALADALAIAPVSVIWEAPVLLTRSNEIPAETIAAMDNLDVKNVTIIGGTSAITSEVASTLTSLGYIVDRLGESGREETALKIAQTYFINPSNLIVAYGRKSADALVGGYLGNKMNAPILLTHSNGLTANTKAYITANPLDTYVLGGTSVITNPVFQQVVTALETASSDLLVQSVNATSATKVKVVFNKAVDSATLFINGSSGGFLGTATATLTSLDGNPSGALKGDLSIDGKTLIITSANALSMRYGVVIDGLKATNGSNLVKYESMITIAADTTAPTIIDTERISSNQFNIKFSEPVMGGTISAKYADNTTIIGIPALSVAGVDTLNVNLAAATITENKDIVITFNGLTDVVGNLISPQPSSVTVKKLTADGIEPTITSVTQTGAKKFMIVFSKGLAGLNFTADGVEVDVSGATAVTAINQISPSEYEVTTDINLNGSMTVTVKAGKAVDFAGQMNTVDLNKNVTFIEHIVAP